MKTVVAILACALLALPAQAHARPLQTNPPLILLDSTGAIDAPRASAMLSAWMRASLAPHWRLLPEPILLIVARDLPPGHEGDDGFHRPGDPLPIAYVRYRDGDPPDAWLVAASHELAEATADPNADAAFPTALGLLQVEIADPVETQLDPFAYAGSTYWLADFVFPSYFNPLSAGPFDEAGALKSALHPLPGCSQEVYPRDGPPFFLHD